LGISPGSRLGDYEVISLLGAGGMGEVYRAKDLRLDRLVALKVLPDIVATDPDRLARFRREAQIVASLNHPNIAQIHGLEESDRGVALILELVEGPTLADHIEQGQLSVAEGMRVGHELAKGIAAAHEYGVIHRDLKPTNVKLGRNGGVKILDFGLAKTAGGASNVSSNVTGALTLTTGLTSPGTIMGTAAYMSPEQARGELVTQATDVWAWACVLFELLSGSSAFGRATFSDTIAAVLIGEPDWRTLPATTPPSVRTLLRKCLTKPLSSRETRLDIAGDVLQRASAKAARGVKAQGTPGLAKSDTHAPAPKRDSGTHSAVKVLIVDVVNATDDHSLDRGLESVIRSQLERAKFITASTRAQLGLAPSEILDETTAAQRAIKECFQVLVRTTIETDTAGFLLTLTATQAISGRSLFSESTSRIESDQVVKAVAQLAYKMRRSLGDDPTESDRLFEMITLGTTSLEAVRHYAASQEAAASGRFQEAKDHAQKAVEADPSFGIAHHLLGVASQNLGDTAGALAHVTASLRFLDGMTERERFVARGMYHRLAGNFKLALREYGESVARFNGDAAGHNQLAMCYIYLRDFRSAVREIRTVVELLPNRALFHVNLSLYATYAGEITEGLGAARRAIELGLKDWGLFALAKAQIAAQQLSDAAETYRELEQLTPRNSARATEGLASLLAYQGDYSSALEILQAYASRSSSDGTATPLSHRSLLAYLYSCAGHKELSLESSRELLSAKLPLTSTFECARVFAKYGDVSALESMIDALSKDTGDIAEAYGRILEAAALRVKGTHMRPIVKLLNEANECVDTWEAHFELGTTYLEAGQFVQADSELDHCIKRTGEVLSLDRVCYHREAVEMLTRARSSLGGPGPDATST